MSQITDTIMIDNSPCVLGDINKNVFKFDSVFDAANFIREHIKEISYIRCLSSIKKRGYVKVSDFRLSTTENKLI